MTRHKGATRKGAPDMADLAILARIVRELQDMGAAINMQHPIAAARSTVFAGWVEISGEGLTWSAPPNLMLPDGRSRRTLRQTP